MVPCRGPAAQISQNPVVPICPLARYLSSCETACVRMQQVFEAWVSQRAERRSPSLHLTQSNGSATLWSVTALPSRSIVEDIARESDGMPSPVSPSTLCASETGAANIVMPSERSAFVDVLLAILPAHRSCCFRLFGLPCPLSACWLDLQDVSHNSVTALYPYAHVGCADCAFPNRAFDLSPAALFNATCSRTQLDAQSDVRFVGLPLKSLYTFCTRESQCCFRVCR